jgi:hypothetical protein
MTECENRFYVTIPTHLITEAWMSAKKATAVEGSWKDDVTLHSPCRTIQVPIAYCAAGSRKAYCEQDVKVARTFDPDPKVFPSGFQHDLSLIDVTALPGIRDALGCPQPTEWLSDKGWFDLRFHDSSTLHLLSDPEEAAKSIRSYDSETSVCCSIVRPRELLILIQLIRSSVKQYSIPAAKKQRNLLWDE